MLRALYRFIQCAAPYLCLVVIYGFVATSPIWKAAHPQIYYHPAPPIPKSNPKRVLGFGAFRGARTSGVSSYPYVTLSVGAKHFTCVADTVEVPQQAASSDQDP